MDEDEGMCHESDRSLDAHLGPRPHCGKGVRGQSKMTSQMRIMGEQLTSQGLRGVRCVTTNDDLALDPIPQCDSALDSRYALSEASECLSIGARSLEKGCESRKDDALRDGSNEASR